MENFGEWLITAVDASSVKSSDLFSKSDLYVIIKFAGKTVKTKTIKNQDRPVWKETFAFPCQKNAVSDIEVTVMDDNLFKDDKITVSHISTSQFPAFGEEKEYNIPLLYKNKDVGILHLLVKNNSKDYNYNNNYGASSFATYGDNNNYNNNNYDANSSNISRGGYDSTVLGGHSYGNNNNQAREVYHNVTETRYYDTQFVDNNHNHNLTSTNPIGSVSVIPNTTAIGTAPNVANPTVKTSAMIPPPSLPTNVAATTTTSSKVRKERKVRLPEKHHHYDDGYTSSSSESSNEGEKRRLGQQNVVDADATHHHHHHHQI